MIVFENFFTESNGKPFIYQGKEIKLSDCISVPKPNSILEVEFISTDSAWKQGIVLQTKGVFEVNMQMISNKIILWDNTTPKEAIKIMISSRENTLFVYNVWDTGDGTVHYGHNGGALYMTENNKIRTYNCNDGHPNDDFSDLIFTIKWVEK